MIKKFLHKRNDYSVFLLSILLVISISVLGFFYMRAQDFQLKYLELSDVYAASINTSSTIRSYYQELQENFRTLQSNYEELSTYYDSLQATIKSLESDYIELENMYASLLFDKQNLQQELEDIMNLQKKILLENNRTLEIDISGNFTLSYDTWYAGYIEVNFTASSDVILWVGSSILDTLYYARIPPSFPETSKQGSFVIPTCDKIFVFLINPSETMKAEIMLTVTYYY